jgi:hypothetical protein
MMPSFHMYDLRTITHVYYAPNFFPQNQMGARPVAWSDQSDRRPHFPRLFFFFQQFFFCVTT